MAYGSLVSLVFLHSSLLRHLNNGLLCKMLRFKELGGVQKFSCQTEMVATSIHTTSAYSPSAEPCFYYMSRTSSVANSVYYGTSVYSRGCMVLSQQTRKPSQTAFTHLSQDNLDLLAKMSRFHGAGVKNKTKHTFFSLNTVHFIWKQHRQYSELFVSLYAKVKIIKISRKICNIKCYFLLHGAWAAHTSGTIYMVENLNHFKTMTSSNSGIPWSGTTGKYTQDKPQWRQWFIVMSHTNHLHIYINIITQQ